MVRGNRIKWYGANFRIYDVTLKQVLGEDIMEYLLIIIAGAFIALAVIENIMRRK